jgi:hypothetical protein
MKDQLTDEERTMMARIVSSDKWDSLIYDISILGPSFIIVGFGIYLDSMAAIITGLVVYAGFALRMTIYQARTLPILKSLIEKLSRNE